MQKIFYLALAFWFFVAPMVRAATIEHLDQSSGSKKINLLGTCRDAVTVNIFATSTRPIYSQTVPCLDNHYELKDDLDRWLLAQGTYRLEVTEKNIKIVGEKNEMIIALPPVASSTLEREKIAQDEEDSATTQILKFTKSWLKTFYGEALQLLDQVTTTILTALYVFTKELVLITDGGITVPRGTNQMSGNAIIKAQTTNVIINNAKANEQSVILLSSNAPILMPLSVTEKKAGQFSVSIPYGIEYDIPFNWLIINTYTP